MVWITIELLLWKTFTYIQQYISNQIAVVKMSYIAQNFMTLL